MKGCLHYFFFVCAAVILNASPVLAIEDGFSCDKKAEGKYITAYCPPEVDVTRLSQLLDMRPSDKIMTGQSLESGNASGETLAPALDTLFLKVSDILDMHLYSLRTDLKICRTNEELAGIYKRLFGSSLGGRRSFYVYDLNSIYVSADDFRAGIIGHEMSHAIISHYFAIPAPVKVQEVLSMYVEYNLKD